MSDHEYFDQLGSCFKERDGQVMNFVGDGATCSWKITEPSKPARLQSSLAALDILLSVRKFNEKHPDECFQTRIGLHVGTVAISGTGGGGHFSYGIQGDTINAASRIEQLNKKLGTFLLVSAEVVKELDILLVRRLGDFVLKGKAEILTVVEIVERRERATRNQYDLCRRFGFAMEQCDKQH